MTRAFVLGLRLYARLIRQAVGPRGRRMAPLGFRRLLALLLLFPLFMALQVLHWLGFLVDELLFRGYRQTPVRRPLFITGIPRSGTTFLHRTLARDEAQFTTFRTWEAIFAPSVAERRLYRGLARVDRLLGSPLRRLIDTLTRRLTGRLAHIHEVGLQAPEEDYLALLPVAGAFILALAFPASRDLWQLGRLDELPEKHRRVLLDFYTACLKKHLYVAGPGRRLLSKNAAFGAWVPELAERFPDARFLVCVRDPVAGLRSQLSSLRGAMTLFGTQEAAPAIGREFEQTFEHIYRRLRVAREQLSPGRLAVIDHAHLKADGEGTLKNALDQLDIPFTDRLRTVISEAGQQARRHTSGHHHQPPAEALPTPEAEERLRDLHAALLEKPPIPASHPEPSATPVRKAGRLRVAIFSDALPERNGAGAYYEDIAPQLRPHLEALELFRPVDKKRLLHLALPLPGDSTQKIITPNLPRLRRAFRRLDPDLVVAVTPGPFGLLGLHLARQADCGFLTGFHTHFEGLVNLYGDSRFYRLAGAYLRRANRRLFRFSDAVLVTNRSLEQSVRSLGARTVEVMGTPLATTFLETPPEPPSGRLERVLFAGRLAPEKNIPAIITAVEALPELEFVMAGEGPLRGELEATAARCPNLRLTGWLGREDLCREMDAANLLILPSHMETFGTVALEAMARGRPALVAESAGIHHWPALREALFTLPGDQPLAAALEELAQLDPEQWRFRASAARRAAESLNRATIEEWLDFIERYARAG